MAVAGAMSRPGFLLVLEGIDGTGKSTFSRRLAAWLCGSGREVIANREPTDDLHGTTLRKSAKAGRLSLDRHLSGASTPLATPNVFFDKRRHRSSVG